MPDLDDWRAEVRTWLETNCPPLMRRPPTSEADFCWGGRRWQFASEQQRLWLERMAARGWTVPQWPTEYGGAGLSREKAEFFAMKWPSLAAERRCTVSGSGCSVRRS